MIRNSDVLFGRTAATYKFTDQDTIRQIIKEVSSLQVLGIDKRMPQIMYERGILDIDQIYAILESLVRTRQIKKIRSLLTYNFSEADDQRFCEHIGLDYGQLQTQEALVKLPPEVIEANLPLPAKNLILCLNIKQSLQKAGIEVLLLNVIADKKLIDASFTQIIPDLADKQQVIVAPEGRDERRIRQSIGILISRIAMENDKMSEEQIRHSLAIWHQVSELGIRVKYPELLYYLGIISHKDAVRIAAFLASISKIDQQPRFALLQLDEEELRFFEELQEKGGLKPELVDQGKKLRQQLTELGMTNIHLSEVLILQGLLSRKAIAKKFDRIRKKEIGKAVQEIEIERTEEAPLHDDLEDETATTEKQIRERTEQDDDFAVNWIRLFVPAKKRDAKPSTSNYVI